jgi:flavin reductase (DIM6/NTAB) family NADH-FMN oxidoreductase RutF
VSKKMITPQTLLYPVPVVMVSSGTETSRNIITVAWAGVVCSDPPMVGIGIRPSRYSHELISQQGEFVVNIPLASQLDAVKVCGGATGRGRDKFRDAGLHAAAASIVKAPLISECPVNLECQVRQVVKLGSHDLFLAEIVAIHASEEVLDAYGRIDPAKAKPLGYISGEYWTGH